MKVNFWEIVSELFFIGYTTLVSHEKIEFELYL